MRQEVKLVLVRVVPRLQKNKLSAKKNMRKTSVLTMPKRNQTPERIKHNPTSNPSINIQLPQILDRRYPSLIRIVYVLLETTSNILEELVNDCDGEGGVVSLEVVY